jgi:hypothetical protein
MFDAEHWVLVAEEVTTIAESMESPDAKRTMLAVAADYLRLAERAKHVAEASNPMPRAPPEGCRTC